MKPVGKKSPGKRKSPIKEQASSGPALHGKRKNVQQVDQTDVSSKKPHTAQACTQPKSSGETNAAAQPPIVQPNATFIIETKKYSNSSFKSAVKMSQYLAEQVSTDQIVSIHRIGVDGFRITLASMAAAIKIVRASLLSNAPVEFTHQKEHASNFPLVLVGVDVYLTDEDIKAGNSSILSATRLKRNGMPIRKVKITVGSTSTRDEMLADGAFLRWDYHQQHFDTQSFIIHDRLKQCFKCQVYGHLSMSCTSPKNICGKCSSDTHLTRDCPLKGLEGKASWKCALCGGNHRTSHYSCPVRQKYVEAHPPIRSYAEVTALRNLKIVSPNSKQAQEVVCEVKAQARASKETVPQSQHAKLDPVQQSEPTKELPSRDPLILTSMVESRELKQMRQEILDLRNLIKSLQVSFQLVLKTLLENQKDPIRPNEALLAITGELAGQLKHQPQDTYDFPNCRMEDDEEGWSLPTEEDE